MYIRKLFRNDLIHPSGRSLREISTFGGKSRGISKNTGFQVDHMAVIMVAHGSVKGQLVFKGNVFKVRPRG